MTTVVAKLFNIVQPHLALFGQKDFQQLAVIRRMTLDLNLPVEIVGMPIVREADGLAMSSRNVYLSAEERAQALVLSRALAAARQLVRDGARDAQAILARLRAMIEAQPAARIDYLQICHQLTLQEQERVDADSVLLMAVFIGKTRLIDNGFLLSRGELTMPKNREAARATLENLYRIFTVPEARHSTLGAIDQAISDDVAGFLQTHIVALERSLEDIEADFSSSRIPEEPTFVSEYTEFVKEKLVAQSVHTAAPGFIGHMTSALPYFMLPLSRIMTALNQNLVKVETSKAFTPLERQVLAMLHHLVYQADDAFYAHWMHDSRHALGAFCCGGTIANVTALWVARNRLFAAGRRIPGDRPGGAGAAR